MLKYSGCNKRIINIFEQQLHQSKAMNFNCLHSLLIPLFCISFCWSQNVSDFKQITTDQGLSQSDVNAIFQDQKGFMWFGTHDGLNKYDGYNFKVYKPSNSQKNAISSNLVWKITDDSSGNLWIGTTGGGLNHFDVKSEVFTSFRHSPQDPTTISSDYISALYRDSSNRLWIVTTKGVNYIELDNPLDEVIFHKVDVYENISGHVVFEDDQGQIWLGGQKGVYLLSRSNDGDLYFQRSNNANFLNYRTVYAIEKSKRGNLIIATNNGLYHNDDNGTLTLISKGAFSSLKFENNILWAGSNEGVLTFSYNIGAESFSLKKKYQFNPEFPSTSLSKNEVKSIFIDNTGIVWIGVNGGGVNKYDSTQKSFSLVQKGTDFEGISNSKIRSIFQDSKKSLWIGTEGGGLYQQINNSDAFKNFDFIKKIYAIEEVVLNGKQQLLIGGQNAPGLFALTNLKSSNVRPSDFKAINGLSNNIFSIKQDSDKTIWIGTYNNGVIRWNTRGGSSRELHNFKNIPGDNLSLSNNIIRCIYEDTAGNIWLGTGDGLNLLERNEKTAQSPKFKVFRNATNDETSLSHNYILNVFQSSTGVMWIGTFGGGLNRVIYDSETNEYAFKKYTEKDGLSNNVIKAILEDNQGNLWLSTNKGLNKFNPTEETFQAYDVNDGLQSNEFSELAAFKSVDGRMYFGGVNGFNYFNPSKITNNNIPARAIFTDFSIFNNPISIGEEVDGRVLLDQSINDTKELHLSHQENSFSFEFAALHYASPLKNKYAYKLEGFDDAWIYTTSQNRKAIYTNIETGTYTLKLKASNNDNVWNETPTEVVIHISPPWWETPAAQIGYAIIVFGLLLAFRKYTIIRSNKKYQLELEHLEKEKNDEIQKLKLEFFTNISHEFRTPLTLIKGPLDFLINKGNSLSTKEVNDQYLLIKKNTDFLLRLVNQLLDFRKMDHAKMNLSISKNDMVAFLSDISEPFQFFSHKKNISFEVLASQETLITWFDPNAIEKIVYNLLSNAFKFTPENGEIALGIYDGKHFDFPDTLELDLDKSDYVVFKVKDSGPGIPAHRIKQIFERYYSYPSIASLQKKGTGIGLSFTKNLVELHQGVIKVLSDAENGTTFFVFLPKKKSAYQNKENTNLVEVFDSDTFISQIDAESHAISFMDDIEDNNITRSRSDLPTLLIVDDNQDIRSFIKKGLGEQYYIYEAEDGVKGLALAKKVMPNIVITDIMMPNMNGIELCNELKTTRETSHIAVVMLTAKTSHEIEIEGLKTGADAYIRKPFDIELLELKLTNIIKRRKELRKRFNSEIMLEPSEVTVTSSDEKFLKKAIEITEKNIVNPDFSVGYLVKEMSMSRSNLYIKIKELTGLTSSEFIRNIRLKRAVKLFDSSDLSVKEIMYMTGFNTASYFSKCFKKQFGVVPSMYIRQNISSNSVNQNQDDTD